MYLLSLLFHGISVDLNIETGTCKCGNIVILAKKNKKVK